MNHEEGSAENRISTGKISSDRIEPKVMKPWWNDGDKVAGLAATLLILWIMLLLFAGAIKLITLMF